MSKGINVAGEFGTLFKNTRLAQLQNKLYERTDEVTKAFPNHQVVESLPSSFSRRDFGVKMRVPRKVKRRQIIFEDLDNKYGMPAFEQRPSYYWKKLMFKETGATVNVKNLTPGTGIGERADERLNSIAPSPLIPNATKSDGTLAKPVRASTIAQALDVTRQSVRTKKFETEVKPELRKLRRPFMQWLAKTHPEKLSQADLSTELQYFITNELPKLDLDLDLKLTEKHASRIPKAYGEKLSGTAGLSYNLGGRLYQTPNGIERYRVLPGRYLQAKATGALLGIGGFVGSTNASKGQTGYLGKMKNLCKPLDGSDLFPRELKVPLYAKQAYIDPNARLLSVSVTPVVSHGSSLGRGTGRGSTMFDKQTQSPRNLLENHNDSHQAVNSLLELLDRSQGKK